MDDQRNGREVTSATTIWADENKAGGSRPIRPFGTFPSGEGSRMR